jgi:hypothetical protein
MSDKAIAAALASRLAELGYPVAWENSNFTPPPGEVYLAEALLPGNRLSIGVARTSSDEYAGIYQVTICAPLGGTKGPGLEAVECVLSAFVKADPLTCGETTVTVLRSQREAAFTSGDRWQIPISIYYRATV